MLNPNLASIYKMLWYAFLFDIEIAPRGLFYWHGLTLTQACKSNHMPNEVWIEITSPFSNFNSCTAEVWELISNLILHFRMDGITYPCKD